MGINLRAPTLLNFNCYAGGYFTGYSSYFLLFGAFLPVFLGIFILVSYSVSYYNICDCLGRVSIFSNLFSYSKFIFLIRGSLIDKPSAAN